MVVRLYCLGKKKSIRAQYRCNFSPKTHFELGLDMSVNACKYIRLSVRPYRYSSSGRTAMVHKGTSLGQGCRWTWGTCPTWVPSAVPRGWKWEGYGHIPTKLYSQTRWGHNLTLQM